MKHLKTHFSLARPALMLLAIFCSALAWADNISDEQALQLAQKFVNRHITAAGPRHAPGTAQQVSSAGKVSGLYVFNVGNDEGFVIVSNDDRAIPILGYSDSGSIDLDNIPSNMRAWLQGYADEIAWVQTQSTQTIQLSAPLRINNRQNIGPLLSTTWNQTAPYNNQTPYYRDTYNGIQYSKDYQSGYSHCATGCVATALAQVMKYHQWPSQSTSIPAYIWGSTGITLDGLSATTFDWSNMLNSYSNGYNNTQANAVSTLMKYCGWGVKMNYGPESGSNTGKLLEALTSYFDYESSTTQIALRSLYTYDNWVSLIYNEINQRRPVLFAGISKGGGHEFVCDGYKYEDDTDFFHINWGWGGLSDDYFVLSALKPNLQGTGGSTDLGDGFNSSVEAIIGIQKTGGTGTVLNVEKRDLSKILVVNSMTTDHSSINLGSSINITLNITNNSDDEYKGDIVVGRLKDGAGSYLAGDEFSIPAREARDCTLSYTPDELGTYDLLFFYPSGYGSYQTIVHVYASFTVVPVGTPIDLTVSDLTRNSAILRWTDISNANQWVVAYKTKGETSFTEVTANNKYLALSNLSLETEYSAKVRPANNTNLWSEEITFTTLEAYPIPRDLAVTDITHNTANATWTSIADSYEVRYGQINGNFITTSDEWLQYDNQRVNSIFNLGLEEYTWGVMFPGEKVTGNVLTKVAFVEIAGYNTEDITVNIYSGGDNAPGTLLHTQVVTPEAANDFHVVELDEPVAITPGENLWITLTEKGQYVVLASNIEGTDPNSQWILCDGVWYQARNKYLNVENRCWLIRGCIEVEDYNYDAVSWIENGKGCSSSWCELTGLVPNSEHVVQVKGKYQDGGESKWATLLFTTQNKVSIVDNGDDNSSDLSDNYGQKVTVQLLGRTLYKDGAWNTICLPFNLTLQGSPLEGAEAKTLANATMTGTHVELSFSDAVDVLQAGVPYIIKWNGGDNIKDPTFMNVTIVSTEGKTITKANGNVKFIGYYDAFDITPANTDIYYMTAENKLKYTGINRTLKACRAYFQFSEAAAARQFVLDFGDGNMTTGIIDIENSKSSDGKWYDLQGRKLSNGQMKKGLYIKDGKKLMVK